MTNINDALHPLTTPLENGNLRAKAIESKTPSLAMEAPHISDNITTLDNEIRDDINILNAKVMIISDDALNADVMSGFLQQFGYTNIISSNEIPEIFDAIFDERPDVILFENTTFKKEDFKLLEKIRNNKTTRRIPIVILTAFSEQETKLQALELGVIDVLTKPATSSELALRLRNILEVKNHHEYIASHDLLTNMPNRGTFLERLEWALKYSKRYNTTGAVLQLELNRFKHLSDAFGPMGSDKLLKAVASRINNTLRESDMVSMIDDDYAERIASRSSGDEFSILLPMIQKADSAAIVANKLFKKMAEPFHINDNELHATCNIGISIFPEDGTNKEAVLHGAIVALHQSNQNELNTYTFYSKELNAESSRKLKLTNDLRNAIKENKLEMYYQPKLEIATGKIIGAESLMRWQHPDYGFISPADFIPLAEESGDISSLGQWAISAVCQQISHWQTKALHVPRIAINISPIQFKNSNLFEEIKTELNNANIDANQIDVEITESTVMSNIKENIEILRSLKGIGVRISIDDFGTGYSSLSHLKQLPLDELKIDRSFVSDIGAKNNNNAIILAIITMAHSMGLNVVAEGVETDEQLNFLKKHQCNIYQGYIFSPAVPAEKFSKMLASKELIGKTNDV